MAKKSQGLVRELPCKLSPTQVNERGPLLSKREIELGALLGAARAKAAEYRVQVKDVRTHITRISKEIDTGHEMREVHVIEKPGITNGTIEVFRVDTGELVETIKNDPERAAALRQEGLFDRPASKKPATSPARKGDKKATPATSSSTKRKAGAAAAHEEHPDATAARTGKPAIGIGEDEKEYKLDADLADRFRAGQDVSMNVDGKLIEIMRLKKPKAKAGSDGVEASP